MGGEGVVGPWSAWGGTRWEVGTSPRWEAVCAGGGMHGAARRDPLGQVQGRLGAGLLTALVVSSAFSPISCSCFVLSCLSGVPLQGAL